MSQPQSHLIIACANGGSCSSATVAGLVVYATFSYYWTTQVVQNIVVCTLAGGVFGGWYYYGPRAKDGSSGVPKNATGKAFGRATTLSLGSIAFGSLIVSILELIETLLRAVQQQQAREGDSELNCSYALTIVVGQILACCVR